MTALIVCGLDRVGEVIAARAPSHLVTLLDPASLGATPAGIGQGRHLRLGINDITEPMEGMVHPTEATVDDILTFGATWDGASPILIHCWAGVSRSTATAFILACERNPGTPELEIARALRAASPTAHPNRLLVRLADDKLGRKGRMVDAIEAIGEGDWSAESLPFELPLSWPARA